MEKEELEKKLLTCALCPTICRPVCPAEESLGYETAAPSGMGRTGYLLLRGLIEWSEENVAPMYYCVGCERCNIMCPFENFVLADYIREFRKYAVERNVLPAEVNATLQNIKEKGNPYGISTDAPKIKGKGKILYFPGCTAQLKQPEIIDATLKLLSNLGIEYAVMENACCGRPALNIGDIETFQKIATQTAAMIKQYNPDIIITGCPTCAETISKYYKKYNLGEFNVMHITVFLSSQNIEFQKKLNIRATFHDPCSLCRRMGHCQEPRKLLEKAGVQIIEPLHSGERSTCCGNGGWALSSSKISELRRKELEETNADLIITACPNCKRNLSGGKLEVKDIIEIISDSMR